jgi:hypothetical protein
MLATTESKESVVASSKSSQRERLEQWSINPDCEINSSSAILNVPLIEVAILRANLDIEANLETVPPRSSAFPLFASSLGNEFESRLFDGNPSLVEKLLKDAEIIENEFQVKVKRKPAGYDEAGLSTEEIVQQSLDSLVRIAKSKPGQAFIINGFSIPGTSIQPDSYLEIDALIAVPNGADSTIDLMVGEVKVYPDKAGRTPAQKTSNTRSQAGLYLYILKNWLEELTNSYPELSRLEVSEKAILFFQDIATGIPKITSVESLHYHYLRSEVAIKNMRRLLDSDKYRELLDETNKDGRADFVNQQPHNFQDSCWSGCPMASACYLKEVRQDRTLILGNLVQDQIPNIRLSRAADLISGIALPKDETEADLIERMSVAKFPELDELR